MQLVAFLLILTAWLNGLHIGPWVSWHSEVPAFAAMGFLGFWVLAEHKAYMKRTVAVPRSALIWPVFVLIAIVQFLMDQIDFYGDVAVLSMYSWLALASVVIGFYAGSQDTTHADKWPENHMLTRLAWVLVLGATISVFIAIVQTLDIGLDIEWINRPPGLRRPGGNIGQPNQLATLLLMGAVSAVYLFEKKFLHAVSASLLVAILIAGIGLTESRTGLISAVAIAVFCMVHGKRSVSFDVAMGALAGMIWLVACFKFLPLGSQYFLQAGLSDNANLAVNLATGTRLQIWPQLIDASLLHPWFGWGLRQVPMAHNAVLHDYPVSEAFTYAHSVILDLILGLGYPLALLFFGFVCTWLYRRLRAINSVSTWYCMALLIPFSIHSLLEFPFAYAYLLLPIGLAVGVLEARLAPQAVIHIPWKLAASVAAFMTALMLWSVWEYIEVEEDFRVARMEAFRIGKTPASYDRPHLLLLDQMDAMLNVVRLVPKPGMDPESIELSRKVALRFPWIATQNRYALILALNGSQDESIRQLKVIRAMHGEKTYAGIKGAWQEIANTKYPQLASLQMP